jgi:electron transport complex protein RnfA
MLNIILIALNAILIENYIFVKFLGICPFVGVSKKTDTALGMGIAVIFTMTVSSALTWLIQKLLLEPLNVEYLQTIIFILVIAALVQLVEMFLQKAAPALYQSLGIYIPLITTNCAVLGAAIMNVTKGYNFLESIVYGFASGVGFLIAIVMLSFVRERIAYADIPKPFRGIPIVLIAAGLMCISFMGFQGLNLPF